MNQIERLKGDLARRFPDLAIEIDAPANEAGPWFLDIRRAGSETPVVVEWRSDRGFGVSTPSRDDYGGGPDEVFPNVKATLDRVVQLILSGGSSVTPEAVRLAELRQLRGISQAELAERAGLGQPSIARIEGRDDIQVSTLARVCAALGARLRIEAVFPDGTTRNLEVGPLTEPPGVPSGRKIKASITGRENLPRGEPKRRRRLIGSAPGISRLADFAPPRVQDRRERGHSE